MVNTKALKCRIVEKGMLLKDVADGVGVGSAYMSAIVNGRRPVTLDVANRMQKVLDIPNEQFGYYFLDGEE